MNSSRLSPHNEELQEIEPEPPASSVNGDAALASESVWQDDGKPFIQLASKSEWQDDGKPFIELAAGRPQAGSKKPQGLEPEPPSIFSVGADVTLASKYVWQGFDLSDDKPVIQPEAILTVKDFSAILWLNHNLDRNEVDEIDMYLQYEREIGDLYLAPGYAYFIYPNQDGVDPSQEVFVDLAYSNFLNPSLGIHYDFDQGDGAYFILGVGHEIEISGGNLALGTTLFYNEHYYGFSGIPSLELNTSFAYPIGPATVTPSVSYFATWENGDFRGDDAVPDTFLFFVNFAAEF